MIEPILHLAKSEKPETTSALTGNLYRTWCGKLIDQRQLASWFAETTCDSCNDSYARFEGMKLREEDRSK